jgi:hypothetical protein
MNSRRIAITIALVMSVLPAGLGFRQAGAQVMVPKAEDVRFQLIANEPIAAPDGRSVVAGWSAAVFRDRRADQCYLAFTQGSAMSTVPVPCAR